MPKVGEAVTFVDHTGRDRPALVTAVHGSGQAPSINVVFVSDDDAKTDPYGRQIDRDTSVVHAVDQAARGNFWR